MLKLQFGFRFFRFLNSTSKRFVHQIILIPEIVDNLFQKRVDVRSYRNSTAYFFSGRIEILIRYTLPLFRSNISTRKNYI